MSDIFSALMSAAGAGGGVNPNAWDISKAYYDPGADAGDLSKATYSNISKSVAGQEAQPNGVTFSSDGTKMYIIGSAGDEVNEYSLSIPWVVNTAVFIQLKSVSTEETSPQDITFKPDGTKMYITGLSGADVNEYSLSIAWNINTASYVQNFSVSAQEGNPTGLRFKPDGTKMYVVGYGSDAVQEYDLSTPWDISTASFLQSQSISAQELSSSALDFALDGTKMYVMGTSGDDINEYDLSTAWDVTSATYVQNFSVSAQDGIPQGLYVRNNGGIFYMCGTSTDYVYQYLIGGFSVATEENSSNGLFFKPDGTKMYVIGQTGDDVNEYDLSTAWDILSASYVQNFSVAAKETNPTGLSFKSDGTKMYVIGTVSDAVHEYDLSSAWDVSTASFLQTKSVSAQDTIPEDLFFKDDGTKMYVIGRAGYDVNEYTLSTAWDISSASYVQNFSVFAQTPSPYGLSFKTDGTKMYVNTAGLIFEYALSSAWDISTASYTLRNSTFCGLAKAIFFKGDGTQFFLLDDTGVIDSVLSFKISPD